MTCLSEEISKKLNIYKRNYTEYTKCLVRGKEVILDGKPEEKVRQLFLYFLINQSGLFPSKIEIKVESNNHDIELYKTVKNRDFKPYYPPIMIVEVKREEENLHNHEKQIEKYLIKSCSQIGILYNYHQIITYIKQDAVFTSKYLNSLGDIRSLLLQNSNNTEKDLLDFEKAINGSFDNFHYLAKKYGKYALNIIIFKLKDEQFPIAGCFFKFQDNKVYYDVYGKYAKKQQSFNYQDFEKLVSITY